MKNVARQSGASGVRLGTLDAEVMVVRFLTEERVDPWPPRDVIDFYAAEMVLEAKKALETS
jgi:hypothetical protein